jgi:hypothetical protein
MELFAGGGKEPFALWQLGYAAELRDVDAEQPGMGASEAVPLAPAAPEFAARSERNELVAALAAVRDIGR